MSRHSSSLKMAHVLILMGLQQWVHCRQLNGYIAPHFWMKYLPI